VDLYTPHVFVSGLSNVDNNNFSSASENFSSASEDDESEIPIYIPIHVEGDLILVPVIIKGMDEFKSDLGKKIFKSNPLSLIDNNEEYSLLAINKATQMFKNSEFCNCTLKM
jgi:hypothetical protein